MVSEDDDSLDSPLSTYVKNKVFSYGDIDIVKDDEEKEDPHAELACPFCEEGFTAMEFCCHIYDDHDPDSISRTCPVCAICVGTNMAAHLISQHKFILETLHKHKLSNGESQTILSLLKKEFLDEHQKSSPGRSSDDVSSSAMAPDPLLIPFINTPPADKPVLLAASSTKTSLLMKASDKSMLERNIQQKYISDKDKEKALRIEFVDNLLLSIILDGNL